MSRYECYACKSEHGTDNVVAYCASCYDRLRTALTESRREVEALKAETGRLVREQDQRWEAMKLRAESAEAENATLRQEVGRLKNAEEQALAWHKIAMSRADEAEREATALRRQVEERAVDMAAIAYDYEERINRIVVAFQAQVEEQAGKIESAAEDFGDIAMSDCSHEAVCPQSCHVVIAKDALGRMGYGRPD